MNKQYGMGVPYILEKIENATIKNHILEMNVHLLKVQMLVVTAYVLVI